VPHPPTERAYTMRASFTVKLSAQQVAIIAATLAQVHGTAAQPQFTGEDSDEALYLRNAFTALPGDDISAPAGSLHDFVLWS